MRFRLTIGKIHGTLSWINEAARRMPVLPLFWQGVFLSRKEINMTATMKATVMTTSLGTAFVDGIIASIFAYEQCVFPSVYL